MIVIVIALLCGAVAWGSVWWLERRARQAQPGSNPKRSPVLQSAAAKDAGSPQRPSSGVSYDQYTMTGKETALALVVAGLVIVAVGYLFYQSFWICLSLLPLALFYPRIRRGQLIRHRQEQLRQQFKHALYAIASALSAGKSVENACREAIPDLLLLYPDTKTDLIVELEMMQRRTENGIPIEKSWADFAQRSHVEDIRQFADVFAACKRTGGNLTEVMRRTAQLIGEKLDVQQEIAVLIAQKKFEARLLGIVPFVIIAFLTFSSPDYVAPLYEGTGRLIMTISLALLGVSQWIAKKMMTIGV